MINLYDDFSSEDELEFQMNHFHRRHDHNHPHRRPWIDIEAEDAVGLGAMALPLRRRQLPAVPSPPLSMDWVNLSPYGFPGTVSCHLMIVFAPL